MCEQLELLAEEIARVYSAANDQARLMGKTFKLDPEKITNFCSAACGLEHHQEKQNVRL